MTEKIETRLGENKQATHNQHDFTNSTFFYNFYDNFEKLDFQLFFQLLGKAILHGINIISIDAYDQTCMHACIVTCM